MRETGYLGAISRSLDIAGYQKQLIGTEGAPAAYLFMLFFNLIPLYMDSSARFCVKRAHPVPQPVLSSYVLTGCEPQSLWERAARTSGVGDRSKNLVDLNVCIR